MKKNLIRSSQRSNLMWFLGDLLNEIYLTNLNGPKWLRDNQEINRPQISLKKISALKKLLNPTLSWRMVKTTGQKCYMSIILIKTYQWISCLRDLALNQHKLGIWIKVRCQGIIAHPKLRKAFKTWSSRPNHYKTSLQRGIYSNKLKESHKLHLEVDFRKIKEVLEFLISQFWKAIITKIMT